MSHHASMVSVALLPHSSISTDMLQHVQQEGEYQFVIRIATDGAHVKSYYD